MIPGSLRAGRLAAALLVVLALAAAPLAGQGVPPIQEGVAVAMHTTPIPPAPRPVVPPAPPGVESASWHGFEAARDGLAFAAGELRPAAGLDPEVIARAMERGYAYAYVQVQGQLRPELFDRLHELGVRTFAVFPHQAIQAEIPAGALDLVAGLPGVRWVGMAPPRYKFHPSLRGVLDHLAPGDRVEAWVTLMGDDGLAADWPGKGQVERWELDGGAVQKLPSDMPPGGWQALGPRKARFRRLLEERGIQVHFFRRNTRTYAVTATRQQLEWLARRDEVHFLDLRGAERLYHDRTAPMVGQDAVRAGLWAGRTARLGIIDSGLDPVHMDLASMYAVGFDTTGLGAFADGTGHGTHATATMVGDGTASARYRGMAPAAARDPAHRLYVGRFFDDQGQPVGDVKALYDAFAQPFTDQGGITSQPPDVVNCAWGVDPVSGAWIGTEQECIDVDEQVWNSHQTYIFAAGNAGSSGVSKPAVAKNVLAVGSVLATETIPGDDTVGDRAPGSAVGPAADGRLKPEISAPGSPVWSAEAGNAGGYVAMEGTSHAAAHVSGVLATILDRYSFLFAGRPSLVRAWVMATALKKSGNLPVGPEYGFGLLNGERMMDNSTEWSGTWVPETVVNQNGLWRQWNITVPDGAKRLTVVFAWDEPPVATTGGATPVTGHVDMYLDWFNDQPGGTAGELVSAGNGNYQFLVVEDPPAGTHAIKYWPRDTDLDEDGIPEDMKVAAASMIELTDTRPAVDLVVSATDPYLQPGDRAFVQAVLTSPSHVATNTVLNLLSVPPELTLLGTTTALRDGVMVDLGSGTTKLVLGALPGGVSRAVDFEFDTTTEGAFPLVFRSNNDNGPNPDGWTEIESLTLHVDGTPPGVATNLSSVTHPLGEWSSSTDVTLNWTPAQDDNSGIEGYATAVDTTATPPGSTPDLMGDVDTTTLTLDEGIWYFTLRAVDRSGNVAGQFASYGPVQIDRSKPGKVSNLDSATHPAGQWVNSDSITLTWIAAGDSVSGVDGYSIQFSDQSGLLPDETKDIEEVTDHTATVGEGTWFFTIRAVDNAGNWSPLKAEHGPIQVDLTAPGAATGLASSSHTPGVWSSQKTVDLTWTAAPDNLAGIAGYSLDATPAPALPDTTADLGAVTSLSTALDDGTWYLDLRAVDLAGNWSGDFASFGPLLIDRTEPGLVANLGSSSHPAGAWTNVSQVDLTWDPAPDATSGVAGYSVEFSDQPLTLPDTLQDLGAVTGHSATLGEGVHFFHVRTVDNAGNWSSGAAHYGAIRIDLTLPEPVSNLHSPTHATGVWSRQDGATFQWTAASDALSGLAGYGIQVAAAPGLPPATQNLGLKTSVDVALADGTWYFNIRSVDAAGNWDDGFVSYGPVQVDTTPPDAATGLTSTSHPAGTWVNQDTVAVDWTAALDNASGIGGYSVRIGIAPNLPDQTADLGAVETTTFTLTEGEWYFNLRSVDNAGNWDADFATYGPIRVDLTPPTKTGLTLAGGLTYTFGTVVELAPAATDVLSGVAEMSFSNDGVQWSSWKPFATSRPDWDLAAFGGNPVVGGDQVVYARFRDGAGNESAVVSLSVHLAEPLEASASSLSQASGGTVDFDLYAGADNAGRSYILVGTFSGTVPGVDLPATGGGTLNVPINRDAFTDHILQHLGWPVYRDFLGVLDAQGRALTPSFRPGPGQLPASLVGSTFHFAYAVMGGGGTYTYASPAVAVQITP